MRILFGLTVLIAALCVAPQIVSAETAAPIGAGPSGTSNTSGNTGTAGSGGIVVEPESNKKVKPGQKKCNNDGVCVENKTQKRGKDATMTPGAEDGDVNSETEVKTLSGSETEISGLDGNDTVNLASSNTADISGTGGTINMSGGSTVTVSNTNPPSGEGEPAGPTITVKAGGTTVTVPAGATGVTISS